MKKYFSVDISHDGHPVLLHDTLDEAKKACLHNTTEQYDYACEMDDINAYECCVDEAIYGVVMGRCESTSRAANKEDSHESQYDYIVESPELVEYNGWIACYQQLPEPIDTSIEFRNSHNRHMIYYSEDGEHWFVGFGWYLYGDKEDEEGGLIPYWELDEITGDEVDVLYWQPLPPPPMFQQK